MPDPLHPSFTALLRMASSEWPHDHPPDAGLANVFWAARVAARALPRIAADEWDTDPAHRARDLSALGQVVFRVARAPATERAVTDVDGTTVHTFRGARGRVHVTVAAKTDDEASAVLPRFREALPAPVPAGTRVAMQFWSYQHGASSQLETVDVCRWPDVSSNYPARTREKLEPLMHPESFAEHGKMVLWLGPPGAGKVALPRRPRSDVGSRLGRASEDGCGQGAGGRVDEHGARRAPKASTREQAAPDGARNPKKERHGLLRQREHLRFAFIAAEDGLLPTRCTLQAHRRLSK